VGFLLVLIELYSLTVLAEALRANICSKSAISLQLGPIDPKFHVEGIAPTNHTSQKTTLNDLSYGIKIWTDLSSVLPQITCLIDRQTEFSSLDGICIPCSAVKIGKIQSYFYKINYILHVTNGCKMRNVIAVSLSMLFYIYLQESMKVKLHKLMEPCKNICRLHNRPSP